MNICGFIQPVLGECSGCHSVNHLIQAVFFVLIYLQMLETPEEKSKFEQIYLEYRNLMFYVSKGILHNQQDAEDAVQEAFLKIIKIIDQIEDPKCPKTKNLTVMIVERTAIDLWRRQKKLQRVSMEEDDLELGSVKEIESVEHASTLALAMATLPAKYREVLLLRYDNGFSEAEIANILSMSLANVHKTIQRAKKKLEQTLEEQEG